jgi:hypothetical protein
VAADPAPSSAEPVLAQPHSRPTGPSSASTTASLLHDAWLPVTVRIAWELAIARIRIRPAVLSDIREHVLRSLPSGTPLEKDCDPIVALYTREYLDRVRADRYAPPVLAPWMTTAIPAAWKPGVESVLDPIAQRVLRFHYGDGLTLGHLERTFHVDHATLEAVRSGIREVLAQLAVEHPAERTVQSDEESDLVLSRIATMTSGRCPGPMGLASEEGRHHAERCARCAHALRLIRRGALSPNDLFVPDGPVVPSSQVGVVALVLHPDAHRHKKLVAKALGELAIPAGADAWLFDAKDQEPIETALRTLCELGTPPRYHLRAARVVGEGRWRRGVVLGPLPHASLAAARSALWSELDGFEPLPAPRPPPPRARGSWLLAASVLATAVAVGATVRRPPEDRPAFPLEATFASQDGRLTADFDTDDLATVDVILERGEGEIVIAQRALREGKGALSTGQGDYRLGTEARRAAIISSEGIDDLELLVAAASADPDSLDSLRTRVRARHPRAAIALSPPPAVPSGGG